MTVEVGMWRLGGTPQRLNATPIDTEAHLEDILVADLDILARGLMLIGRQIMTVYGKYIDLLAVDRDGALHVIELKRDKTPREVVAQTLDYASWVRDLSYEEVVDIYSDKNDGEAFEIAFSEKFGSEPPESLNDSHQLIIVASELDASTERIIDYLADDYGVPINAVFFQHFLDGDREYLSRSWLIEHGEGKEVLPKKSKGGSKQPWNGKDFYVAFGACESRSWADAVKYGFVCGGGGTWYSKSLYQLDPGKRIFTCIPKTGYVGVGIVEDAAVPFREFTVQVDGQEIPLSEAPIEAPAINHDIDDDELCEHIVRVKWVTTLVPDDAIWEKGMYANQNTATKMRNAFTLERLIRGFELDGAN